jgi:hypothetical protein
MFEFFSRMQPGEFIGLVAVLGAFLCAIIAIVMGIGYAIRNIELTAALKKDMLERGMSPEDIKLVIEAGSAEHSDGSCKDRASVKGRPYAEV